MLGRLYAKWGMDDDTDFQPLSPRDYPVLSDLYDVIEEAYRNYDSEEYPLYPRELLQEVLLGLHSMCRGAESKFFNGHTNITTSRFLVFGVKGLLQASRNVKNALLFNVLSYLSDKLLTKGNTAAGLDELYIWLSNLTAIEYIRNSLKRVRKKESSMILASQNLEDFDVDGVRELTRRLFAIPYPPSSCSTPAVWTRSSIWTTSSWSLLSSSSSVIPSGASASTAAATSGICWRSTRRPIRRSCSGQLADDKAGICWKVNGSPLCVKKWTAHSCRPSPQDMKLHFKPQLLRDLFRG